MQNTTENNKLIAEFMDLSKWESDGKLLYSWLNVLTGETLFVPPSMLKYERSWEWLMPVLKKVNSYANDHMTFSEYYSFRISYRMIIEPTKYHI